MKPLPQIAIDFADPDELDRMVIATLNNKQVCFMDLETRVSAYMENSIEVNIPSARFEGKDKRFAGTAVYHVPNRELAKWRKFANPIPHSHLYWIDYVSAGRGVTKAPHWAGIIWYRAATVSMVYEAIATISMLTDKTIILLRTFESPLHRSDI